MAFAVKRVASAAIRTSEKRPCAAITAAFGHARQFNIRTASVGVRSVTTAALIGTQGPRISKQHIESAATSSTTSSAAFVRKASTVATGELRRTPLYDMHVEYGGSLVPFGGFEMPVQYKDLGIGESHNWTREKASIFDVGHM